MEGGSGSSESSTVEQETHVGIAYEGCDESSELELGLGLSLGNTNTTTTKNNHNITINSNMNSDMNSKQQIPRILTAKDLASPRNVGGMVSPPSSASSCSSLGLRTAAAVAPTQPAVVGVGNAKNGSNAKCGVTNNSNNVSAGTKRAASPTAVSQVVGWPPIRSYRMNSMANQAKSIVTGEQDSEFDEREGKVNASTKDRVPQKSSLFVKVNMDGVAIGRKVDLNAHPSYESLAQTLEEMFTNRAAEKSSTEELILMPKVTRTSKLLDGLSDHVLTYEDKDGDWMLVGDVPWGMFLSSVKRLRIMRTSEANGLAPRLEERSAKQRTRPI